MVVGLAAAVDLDLTVVVLYQVALMIGYIGTVMEHVLDGHTQYAPDSFNRIGEGSLKLPSLERILNLKS
jgi:hypothetical protein